jgi:dihydroxy-acid dehydratase
MEPNHPHGNSEAAGYVEFPYLPHGTTRDGELVLNRYSTILTRGHDFPGAQVLEN